ncbi:MULTISPECIES: DUF4834 family protein [Algibacter]|jgi:hypothetical protein|uniref:Uncharacterized protein DUF4834 n=1 Tax=Algibacter lectus TaxID=221126 RepID=A0A090WWA5_9FLAO|nr:MULTISPECIES: DUF4834 family protein [Algibacter]MDO7138178.1 DUF4834 family protein [Algibacter lectus]MWW25785.1 DUF4834 family protein [Algibacter lectus]TDY61066.1 uncharacterized protein DUF4834 [Algibacter lectus]SFD68268.1 protein of unknown function [Algibacter lectus]GAL63230.1 hypothetical protein JCM19300_1252 [Algibacter lectus]
MGLLRTIFIIVLVYYLFKVLSRIFAPLLMKFAVKKAEERFGGQFQKQQQEPVNKEGEVTIDKIPNTRTSNKDVGDYVDYEEVD